MAKNKTVATKEIKKGFDWTLNITESKRRIRFAPSSTNMGNKRKQASKKACRGNFNPTY